MGRTTEEQSQIAWRLVAGLCSAAGLEAGERDAIAEAALGELWSGSLSAIAPAEVSDATVSGSYEALVRAGVGDSRARRTHGIYYTPADAADRLVAATDWGRRAGALRCADAACGTGTLLVAAWEAAPSNTAQCYGVDVDAVAVAVARARLMLRRLAAGLSFACVADWIVFADALATPPPWPTAFDLVVGNPPFGNAIEKETARTPAETALMRSRFPHAAQGAFDRASLFAELSLSWAARGGAVALILPRTMQTVAYAAGLRRHWEASAAVEVVEEQRPIRFAGATVSVSYWLARAVHDQRGAARWAGDGSNGWEPWLAGWPLDWKELGATIHFQSGATVSEAYEQSDLLTESGEGFRFVTAGALDPHQVAWGRKQRYLGRDWCEPRLSAVAAGRRAPLYGRPKVCLPALSRVLEAALDESGDCAAAVSVLVGWPLHKRGVASLRLLACLMNTALMRLRYQTANAPQAMAGGSVPVSKRKLLSLTAPDGWWFGGESSEPLPPNFATVIAALPPMPAKRLASVAELAALESAVRGAGEPASVWSAVLAYEAARLPAGGDLGSLQPLADGCLMAHYLCLGRKDAS